MKKILVTGGAGFIGSNLVEQLIKNGHHVTVIDNLSSGYKSNLNSSFDKINFIHADICEKIESLDKHDEIYHLACQASPPKYQHDPIHTLDTCYLGTKNILDLAKRWQSPILFSSTSEIYGDPLEHPQTENYRGNVGTTTPRSCYDEGKRIAETLCYEYSKDVVIKVARIFNTYGPKMDPEDGRVVSNFIWQAIHGKSLTIFGEGDQTRSLCFVSDNVDALQQFMATETGQLKILNIGNDAELTILELAQKVIEYFDQNLNLEYQPLPEADPTKRKPDLKQAYEVINWQPQIPLEQGLKDTIKYFKETAERISSNPQSVSSAY